jgi:dTDP-D-glucose 4,6-dehydratase
MRRAGAGETYNVGGKTERRNIDLVHRPAVSG